MTVSTGMHDPAVVHELLSRLEATPAAGRDAVLQAYLPRLQRHRSTPAVSLLSRIVANDISGLSPAVIAELAEALHPDMLVRMLPFAPRYPIYPVRYLLERLRWRDTLSLVADIRDGRASLSSLVPPEDGVLAVAVLLANGEHLDREAEFNLHRSSGAESVFLFGASRDPVRYLRAIESVRIYTWPRPNRDAELLAWALRNPALGGTPRDVMLRKNAASALAPCRLRGLVTTGDLHRWLAGDPGDRDAWIRVLSVLALGDDVPGARSFKMLALRSIERLDELAAYLAPADIAALAEVLPAASPEERETITALLPDWSGDLASLLHAARVLPGS